MVGAGATGEGAPGTATGRATSADAREDATGRATGEDATGHRTDGDTPDPDDRASTRTLSEAVGGPLGTAESVLPPTAYVVVYLLAGQDAGLAATVAIVLALGLSAARLLRGQTLQFALSGLVGVAIAAFVVSRTGRPEDFFLPSLLWNVGYGAALLVSIAVGWPLVGLLIGAMTGQGTAWREDPGRRALYRRVTWLWVALFAARILVKTPLYLAGSVVALGVVHVAMGVPLYLLLLWVTFRIVREDLGEGPRPATA